MQSTNSIEVQSDSRSQHLGSSGGNELEKWIASTRFFAQAPEYPGFLATPSATGPVIPIFTSLALLARHAGPVRWRSTTGAEMIGLTPVGHRFVVDPGTPGEIVLDPNTFARPETSTGVRSRPTAS